VISGPVSETIRETCLEISDRYEINFIEIETDEDHVHFLVQSVPVFSVEKIVRTIKSILGRLILSRHAEIKQELWGGNFWTSGYYANTVGQYGNEEVIKRYVESQGKKYVKIYDEQLHLF